jgi:hypothetical protein
MPVSYRSISYQLKGVGKGMKERRRFRRVDIDVLVNFSEKAIARAKNVNQFGICIVTNIPFKAGIYLNLIFTLPDGTSVETLGKVQWQRKIESDTYENGIEFYNIKPDIKKKLEDFVREYGVKTEEDVDY